MSKILDVLGREIKVGDIVVATQNSTLYHPFGVITRLGAKDNAQVNGASYVHAGYLMVCNEQYVIAKGQEAADDLIAQHASEFNHEQVSSKLPSPKFLVYGCCDYEKKKQPRFFVVKLQGNTQEQCKQFHEFIGKFDFSEYGQYYLKRCIKLKKYDDSGKKIISVYDNVAAGVTLRELKEMDLDGYIDTEIMQGSEAYEKLKAVRMG